MKRGAGDICRRAAALVEGARATTHGNAMRNHANIAELWNAFLAIRRDRMAPLSAADVAKMRRVAGG